MMKSALAFLILFCVLVVGCNRPPQQNMNPAVGSPTMDSTRISVPGDSSVSWISSRGFHPDLLVETVLLDADGDGSQDTIRLYRPSNWDDPGDFHFVEIAQGSNKRTLFQEEGGWVSFGNALDTSTFSTLRAMSLVRSQNLFVLRVDSVSSNILLFGYQYASSPGLLTVLNISRDSIRRLVNEEIAVDSIGDVDLDGKLDLIGCGYSEVWGSDSIRYTSYNPWEIYSLETFNPLGESAIQKYNEAHYYGNPPAGSKGPYLVVHLPQKKPFVMSEDEAYSKYGR